MLKSRISTTPDVGRLGAALSRPGIDPRVWASIAVVTAVHVDAAHGVFADVILLPDNRKETARVSSVYAGPNYGLYFPLDVDDEVLVIAPSGDPNMGLVILPRMWSGADNPPADASSHTTDLLLLAKQDATVRIAVQGSGNVVLDPRGSGKVLLGSETGALEPAVLGQTLQSHLQNIYLQLTALFTAYNAGVGIFNGHTHAGVKAGTDVSLGPSAPQVADPTAITAPPDVKAQKVEVF